MLPENAADQARDRKENNDLQRDKISPPSKERIIEATESDDWETAFKEFFHIMSGQTYEEFKASQQGGSE